MYWKKKTMQTKKQHKKLLLFYEIHTNLKYNKISIMIHDVTTE